MDKIKGLFGDALPEDLAAQFPDGLPDISQLQGAIDGKSEAELTASTKEALKDVDPAQLSEFGTIVGGFMETKGATVPAGVSTGNAGDISSMLGGMMKGGSTTDFLQTLQDASGGGGMGDSIMDKVTGGKFDLISLIKNPAMAAVLIPIIKNLTK